MKKIIFIFIGLYSLNAFAYYTENIPNQCGVLGNNLHAVFTISEYTCNYGEFLPAYSLGCESCPDDFTCSGGTYTFNDNEYQGATKSSTYITHNMTNMCATNAPHELIAKFTPNVHNCSAGYYLPAGIDRCVKCLNDSYCPGGTYTFNETTDQGINNCPSAHPYAPQGMWLESQCGRKLHIGEEVLYVHQMPAHPTVHRLYIGHPNGIYSANTVARDMNSNTFPKMSEGMSKGFHVTINGAEYLICDDSVPECRND
jgi:hypothetical protein